MQHCGWTLPFRNCVIDQLRKLHQTVERARRRGPAGFASTASVQLFHALSRQMRETVPQDPSRKERLQGSALGTRDRQRRCAKIARRFRLYFRYDARAKMIVYAWVKDQSTLRSSGSRTDPYAVFTRMLAQGNPPDDWATLMTASRQDWQAGKQSHLRSRSWCVFEDEDLLPTGFKSSRAE
ncbi:MAG: type II toxin-antitoxin system YhaV family toxin [Albidovulum sp.]|nr:type II toxin-antitoxin system YhaV family toxin [Albidovulum sp.]MDE0534403.1 type II toxin-antitoxin system YhaV family toxin [Albidovulum sp.]